MFRKISNRRTQQRSPCGRVVSSDRSSCRMASSMDKASSMDAPAEGGTGGSAFAMEEVTAAPSVVPELEDTHTPMPTMLRMRRCLARAWPLPEPAGRESARQHRAVAQSHRMCSHICAHLHPHPVLMLAC